MGAWHLSGPFLFQPTRLYKMLSRLGDARHVA